MHKFKNQFLRIKMSSFFINHVIGDLTVGKPELIEFKETQTIEEAIKAIGESTECGIPIWRKKNKNVNVNENVEMRQLRFVGILNSLDIVAFLANEECLVDQEMAMKIPVSEVVVPNMSLLKELDPGTRLMDALEMMKQGVKRLLVPKSDVWKGMSKRFSVLYHGKWLNNIDTSNSIANANSPSTSSTTPVRDKFCCLSREDVIRFVIDCLGALAPLPLTSISSLGAINPNYRSIEASQPAVDSNQILSHDPSAVAVVEAMADGCSMIIGEISATKLWKCDYLAAAWALANLSSGQFVMGVEDNVISGSLPDTAIKLVLADTNAANGCVPRGPTRPRISSSRSIGFISNPTNPSLIFSRSMYRGRSAPLTCKETSSLAAVMAQMLSHRSTHVWVTEAENEDHVVGVVGYADILAAITKPPHPTNTQTS